MLAHLKMKKTKSVKYKEMLVKYGDKTNKSGNKRTKTWQTILKYKREGKKKILLSSDIKYSKIK